MKTEITRAPDDAECIKMTQTFHLPAEFTSICNAAVEHALTGAPIPLELPKLMEWLETDGWDEVLSEWDAQNDPMAVKLQCGPQSNFHDFDVKDFVGLDLADTVTDEMRVEFARHRIAYLTSGEDGSVCPSIHCYNISHEDGRSAVIGFTVEIHGQSGPVVVLQGVFHEESIFFQAQRDSGYCLPNEVDEITDDAILKLFASEKQKKTSISRQRR